MTPEDVSRFWNNKSLKTKLEAWIAGTIYALAFANFTADVKVKKGRGQRRNRRNNR